MKKCKLMICDSGSEFERQIQCLVKHTEDK